MHSLLQLYLFSDLLVSDYPNYMLRFLMIYNIISLVFNNRFLFKGLLSNNNTVNSIVELYTCATWYERESWDLYGVFFYNNLDLRRILNDYGFFGHSFKKDFPLSGFSELIYVLRLGSIISLNIKMMQEFRFFSRNTPWKYNYFLNNSS